MSTGGAGSRDREPLRLDQNLDLIAVMRVVASNWYWVLCLSLAFAAAFGAYSWRSSRIYVAESLVTIVEDPAIGGGSGSGVAKFGAVASAIGLNISGSQDRRAEYVALLSSRGLIADLIANNNLMYVLYESRWDKANRSWKKSWYSDHTPSINDGVEYFRARILKVVDDKRTGLVTLKVEWRDPKLAAAWANMLIGMVNDHVRKTTIAQATRSIEFLNIELRRVTEVQVRESIYRLVEANLGKIALANAQEQYALKTIDPARAADRDQYVRPRPLIAVAGGLVFGLLFSVMMLLLRDWRRLLVNSDT